MTAYIALGSNLGDRLANLRSAAEQLRKLGTIAACSSVYETEPREYTDQPWFLNAVVALESDLSPQALMQALLHIESSLGRQRRASAPPKGPRVIDLDLLLHDNTVLNEAGLHVPHPRLQERLFVLAPLSEIAPELIHPTLQRPILELLNAIASTKAAGVVRRFASPFC